MNKIFYKKIKNQSGELLINLLISIGIIAILSVISIPLLKNYQPNLKLSLATRELVSDLRYAQQQTITEQISHRVRFATSTNSYDILKIDTATTTLKSTILPVEVSFSEINGFSDNTVVFNFYGASLESGYIKLLSTASSTKIINIKPSGYVELPQ